MEKRFFKKFKQEKLEFEEVLGDEISSGENLAEVSLKRETFLGIKLILAAIFVLIAARLIFFGAVKGKSYNEAALNNRNQNIYFPNPRGIIFDRFGKPMLTNNQVSSAILDIRAFLNQPQKEADTLELLQNVLGADPQEISDLIQATDLNHQSGQILLADNLSLNQIISLKSANLDSIKIASLYKRNYFDGPIFSPLLGYVGLVTPTDLKKNPNLNLTQEIGKSGLEAFYNADLSGHPKVVTNFRDAQGKILATQETDSGALGKDLHTTIDSDFQKYFYYRLEEGLWALGRDVGIGIALNPQTGEVLSLVNIPSFDNNAFSSGTTEEKSAILNSPFKSLFNRAIQGLYNPGSTIKPFYAIAALKENIVTPKTEIFSPGYLDIPNPYNPGDFSRFLDWRYQGWVNLYSAIAWSSDVYFYAVGGGLPKDQTASLVRGGGDISGLGIKKIYEWWQNFGFGDSTGIDLPGEQGGFLPTLSWFQNTFKKPWLLGDTYNVSIGQGDLLLTPIRLLADISAIANGGKVYQPLINKDSRQPKVLSDLSPLDAEIKEAKKGMVETVTDPKGTAYLLHDLPFSVAAKTGSAQIENNAKVNAFFVGFAPVQNPKIAILILIENAKEGSLNTIPIAYDILNWYYLNRLENSSAGSL